MSMKDLGARTAARTTIRHYSVPVAYTRAADGATASLKMCRTSPTHTTSDPEGVEITVQSDDWLCLPADFQTAFGAAAVPDDDDKITCDGRLFRVRPLGGEPCWRHSKDRAFFRIHTKDEGTL
jgi:hypothetical protein